MIDLTMQSNLKVEVHIVSWTGKHDNAVLIANSIKCADKKNIVYSDIDDEYKIEGNFEVVKTNNELYWGDKFRECIASFDSDVLLIIHADCKSKDWNDVVLHCRKAYQEKKDLGLWAPLTYGTAFPVEITALDNNKSKEYSDVNYIDGIVFGLNSKIIQRMKTLDYSKNIYGWGIDWFAAAVSFSNGFKNEVDKTIAIYHPVDRGYKPQDAKNQMKIFMTQLTKEEKEIYENINLKVVKSRENYISIKNNKSNVVLYQSFYKDEHKKYLSNNVMPVDIRGALSGETREYELFKYIHKDKNNNNAAWGLISWKFNLKNATQLIDFHKFANEQINAGVDCVFINPMIGNEAIFKNVWEQGVLVHKGMKNLVEYFSARHGENINKLTTSNHFAFCNYFVAKTAFWDKYFDFIDSEINNLNLAAINNQVLKKSLETAAGYSRDANLPLSPFVIERLFTLFIMMNKNNFTVVNFQHNKGSYEKKFGEKLGVYLWNLKRLKDLYVQSGDQKYYDQWNKIRSHGFKNGLGGLVLKMDDPEVFLY